MASGSPLEALVKAVLKLPNRHPGAGWAQNLSRTITSIRERALSGQAFRFPAPQIIPQRKEIGGHAYRPLATFNLDDKIIENLTARYLRETLDPALLESCLAFRSRRPDRPPPATHDALKTIIKAVEAQQGAGLFVAECDIKGSSTASHTRSLGRR